MTRKHKITAYAIIAAVFVLTLCVLFLLHNVLSPSKPAPEEVPVAEPAMPEPEIIHYADISELPIENKTFLYLGSEEDADYLADLALPQRQIVVAHNQNSPDFSQLLQYSVITFSKNSDAQGKNSYEIGSSYYHWANLGGSVQTAPEQAEDLIYAKEFMNSFVYSSNYGLAITDFKVYNAKMEPLDNSGHIYSLSLNADVKPQKSEFENQMGYLWGETDADGYVRNLNLSTILYYYNGNWGCTLYPDYVSPFLTGIDYALPAPKKEFIYKTTEVPWEQVLNENAALEQVFYEDAVYSYISHSVFQWITKDVSGKFTTQIDKLNRSTSERAQLYSMPVNHLYPRVLVKEGNSVLLDCSSTEYPSGMDKGYLFILDLVSGAYKQVLPFSFPILVAEDTVYAVCMEGNAEYEQGIYKIVFNADGLKLNRLGALPGRTFSSQYESCYVTHLNKATNELYLMWPDDTMELSLYRFNLATGISSKVE